MKWFIPILILSILLIAGCTQPIHSTPQPSACTIASDCETWCERVNCTRVACLGFWECLNNSCKWTCETGTDFYYCNQDLDCIKVAGGCCDCGGGGNATSINKNFENEWKDKLSNECKGIGCAAVMSDDPTCFKTAKCIENKCVLE